MTEMKKKDLAYSVEEKQDELYKDVKTIYSNNSSNNKREALKKDLLSRDNILDIKFIAPGSSKLRLDLDSCLHTIESFEVAEEIIEKKGILKKLDSLTGLKYFAIKSHPIDSLAKEKIDGEDFVRVNQDILLRKGSSSEPKYLGQIFFADREDAVFVASVATEVEFEKAKDIIKEAEKIAKFLKDQKENERF